VICHQIAERSFHLDGAQLPVCARCLGIYAGAAMGALAASAGGASRRVLPAPRLFLFIALAAALPTAFTVTLEWAGFWAPSNAARALAGVPLGLAAAAIAMRAITARPALHAAS
jgi:uncharacterized membrane protein